VEVGVELLAQRLELLHAVLVEDLEQLALGELDAVEQRLGRGVGLLAQLLVERAERAVHVVGDGDDVAGEIRDAVDPAVGDLALGAPAQVLHVGERAQQLVLVVGGLLGQGLDQLRDARLFLRLLGRRIAGGGRGVVRLIVEGAGVMIRHHIVPSTLFPAVTFARISGFGARKSSGVRGWRTTTRR
jgi:hypothetical protein